MINSQLRDCVLITIIAIRKRSVEGSGKAGKGRDRIVHSGSWGRTGMLALFSLLAAPRHVSRIVAHTQLRVEHSPARATHRKQMAEHTATEAGAVRGVFQMISVGMALTAVAGERERMRNRGRRLLGWKKNIGFIVHFVLKNNSEKSKMIWKDQGCDQGRRARAPSEMSRLFLKISFLMIFKKKFPATFIR